MRFWSASVNTDEGARASASAGSSPRRTGVGAQRRVRGLWLAVAALLCAWVLGSSAAYAQASPKTAQELLRAYARMGGLEASFVETKQLSLLAKPIESRGRLYFARPGYLLRQVTEPVSASVLITPERVILRDDSGERVLDLKTRSDVRPFVESLVWLLAGDRDALEKAYAIAFSKAAQDGVWKLVLTPKGAPLNQLISEIVVTGKKLFVSQVRVREKSGDETLTRIESANPKRTFSAAERRKLFGSKGS